MQAAHAFEEPRGNLGEGGQEFGGQFQTDASALSGKK